MSVTNQIIYLFYFFQKKNSKRKTYRLLQAILLWFTIDANLLYMKICEWTKILIWLQVLRFL